MGAKLPHASWSKSQNIKWKQYGNKFNKDVENGLPKKLEKILLFLNNEF